MKDMKLTIYCIQCANVPKSIDIHFFVEDLDQYFHDNAMKLDWICKKCGKKNYYTVREIPAEMKQFLEKVKKQYK